MTQVVAVIAVALALLVIARNLQAALALRRQLHMMRGRRARGSDAILDVDAVEACMAPEMRWIAANDRSAAFILLEAYGGDDDRIADTLARVSRVHEPVYRIHERRYAMLLWDVDALAASRAVARLGVHVLACDVFVASAAVTIVPRDALTPDAAWRRAQERRRPLQDFIDFANDSDPVATDEESTAAAGSELRQP